MTLSVAIIILIVALALAAYTWDRSPTFWVLVAIAVQLMFEGGIPIGR